jgi:hemolysin activation/secretion protein
MRRCPVLLLFCSITWASPQLLEVIASDRAVLERQNFSIDAGETIRFVQPSVDGSEFADEVAAEPEVSEEAAEEIAVEPEMDGSEFADEVAAEPEVSEEAAEEIAVEPEMAESALASEEVAAEPAMCEEEMASSLAQEEVVQSVVVTSEKEDVEAFAGSQGIVSDILTAEGKRRLEPFLGREISRDVLKEMRNEALSALNDQGEFAVRAEFPKQDVSTGVVVLFVSVPTVEKLEVKGNRWEQADFYEKQTDLSEGMRFNSAKVLDQVAWLNRNPFRYAEVVVAPGKETETVDVDLLVKDRWMFRPFVGSDNTGTNLTEQTRLFTGVSWGKAFGRSDLLTYQYTTAPNRNRFYAHTGSYQIYLPWKHELTFFGGFSEAHPNIPGFRHDGISVQASMRYAIPFKPLYELKQHTFTWGIDYKNLNSNVFFIESVDQVPVVANQVNISQFFFGYAWKKQMMAVKAELLISPARWLPNQSEQRYHMLRPHSSVQYAYGRIAVADIYGKNMKFAWTFRGQAATGPLLPSEQFALGGYDTVRGYIERLFLADNAFCINTELRATRACFFDKDELMVLVFSDFGYGHNYQSEVGDQKSQYLWSVGPGFRYNILPYLMFRADYGIQLRHLFGEDSFGRFHVGGSVSY